MKASFKETKSGWKYLECLPAEASGTSTDFLIFHGYGAGAEDLVFLQALFPNARWFFPNAFLNQKKIPSWFNGDTEEYKNLISRSINWTSVRDIFREE